MVCCWILGEYDANDVLQQAIMEAYASSPSDVLIYHTLEIKHPDFMDDNRIR